MDPAPTLPKILTAGAVLGATFLLAGFLRGRVMRLGEGTEANRLRVLNLLGHALYVGTVLLGALTALGVLGVNITALVAGLGLTGFAVGFALRDIISNLLAGMLIILYSPFRIGDTIKVGAFEGKVVEVNLRYTVVEREGEKILIPNSTMFTNIITVRKG
ncbi:MAG TPA: mechanosensitive ion channel [Aquifex aeolicus]|uniref:Mechanosensitive ion channel n=1 Tax=Aquifex aeolicus TaxID=63363 RepID=A0A7C5Q826_AQUAO|nr:mechanosensitive ion channel [Aquifex aeolicus]